MTYDKTIILYGVEVKQKIIKNYTKWTDAKKAAAAGFSANSLYKAQVKMSKVNTVTIHNTADLANIQDDAERYVLATYNENMGSVRPHLYVDESSAWQLLSFDEVGWCNARGTYLTGAIDDIAIECIMGENAQSDAIAEDKTARLAAYLLHENGLGITALRTHTYWINTNLGLTGSVDYLNTYISPKATKRCPLYILPHWDAFKNKVKKYLDELNTPKVIYRVRTSSTNAATQIGAYSDLETAKNIASFNKPYKVYNSNNKLVYNPPIYYCEYITIEENVPVKLEPRSKAKTQMRFGKGKKITVYLGSNTVADNGVEWVKFTNSDCEKFPEKTAYIPLKYLSK